MRTKLKWILTLFLALPVMFVHAQQKQVTGTVTDKEGLPLPGVNVVVKGTNRGVNTNFDGEFSIQASEGEVLLFTYLGMKDYEAEVGASSVIDVQMKDDAQSLDEVVVVAYGTQREKAIVGAISTVGADVIEKQQVTSVTRALQGSVPGVNIISSGGQPGTNPTIRIRGVSSINASADPLIVVDGAPYNGNLNSISADQIESMNVLKDASSTALYGSRAANGVIVITTKSGKRNSPPTISVRAVTGVATNAVKLYDLLGTNDYVQYYWEALRNVNQYENGQDAATAGQNAANSVFTNLQYNPYNVDQPIDANGQLVSGANLIWETDWADAMLNDSALRQEYSLNMSGGGEHTNYFFSANYLDQEGSVKTSKFQRIATNLNVDTHVAKWLDLGMRTSFTASDQNFPSQSGSSYQSSIQWIYSMSSIYPLFRRDADGNLILDGNNKPIYDYGSNGGLVNGNRPLFQNENAVGALYNYKVGYKRNDIRLNGYAKVNFSDSFYYKLNVTHQLYIYDNNEYSSNEVGNAASVGGRVSQNRDIQRTLNVINNLHFEKTFGDHGVDADAIFEAYDLKYDALGANGTGFLPNVYVLNGSTVPESVSGYVNQERIMSYLGRLAYSFKDRYFLEGSFRRDGSSRFGKDYRWGSFYSVGGAWVVSDESFFQNIKPINLLKLRASYGELGNQASTSYFPYMQLYETGWNQLDETGILLSGVVDPALTWEKTASFNAGLDLGLFRNNLTIGVNYYSKKSIDLIYDRPLPISTGNESITTNVGAVKNYGWEFMLNSKNISTKDFQWTTGLNFSFDKNEIAELTQDEFINGTKKWKVGKSLYDFYIQEWAGVDPEDGYGMWYMDVLDDDGNPTGERVTTKEYSEATRYYQGSSLPKVIGGFTSYLNYKGFDLNVLFNFSFGSQVYDYSYANLMDPFSSPGYQGSVDVGNRWQQPGDQTDVPLLLSSQNDFSSQSTRFLFDNDYVRLKALTIGYNFPSDMVDKLYLTGLRVYFQGDNLWTYQTHDGIDPEQSLAGTTNSRSYLLKTVSVGVNVQF